MPAAIKREHQEKRGMAIARDDLGRHWFGFEAEPLRDIGLDPRIDVGERADRAGNLAGCDLLARGKKALAVAGELGIMPGQFQPESCRLGVDAVAASDRRGQFMFERAALERLEHSVEIGEQDIGGLGQLYRETGVEHVARRHALMHEARLGADTFGEVG